MKEDNFIIGLTIFSKLALRLIIPFCLCMVGLMLLFGGSVMFIKDVVEPETFNYIFGLIFKYCIYFSAAVSFLNLIFSKEK